MGESSLAARSGVEAKRLVGTVTVPKKKGSRMKLALALSVWLVFAGSVFSAQSSTDPGAKSEKATKVSLSPKFRNLADDTLDAVDRLWGDSAMSDEIFEPAKLEAERLRQKLRRAAMSSDEKKDSDAIGKYLGQIQLCRVVGPSATAYHEECLQKEKEARASAFRLLGREAAQTPSAKQNTTNSALLQTAESPQRECLRQDTTLF